MKKDNQNFSLSQFGKAESKAPAVISIIFLAIAVFLSYKFIPVKVRNMKFQKAVEEVLSIKYHKEYKLAARGGFNEYTMRERVIEVAKAHKIPIKNPDKQMVVQFPEGRVFTIEVNYDEEIKLPLYGTYVWSFHVYVEQIPLTGN